VDLNWLGDHVSLLFLQFSDTTGPNGHLILVTRKLRITMVWLDTLSDKTSFACQIAEFAASGTDI
jgi:hypothetical protein